jgi:diacylglycerol kinase family enzyme
VEEAQAHIARISGELGVRAHVVVTRKGDNISSLAARALSENGHLVVAGGGDGTVSAVAGVLAGTNAAIGVLPMGTLNHFAKSRFRKSCSTRDPTHEEHDGSGIEEGAR